MNEQSRSATLQRLLVPVDPAPTYIESSGRWKWPLPPQARFPGCSTEVVTASREWWEYAPSEAKPHPMAEAIQLRDEQWYWVLPSSAASETKRTEDGGQWVGDKEHWSAPSAERVATDDDSPWRRVAALEARHQADWNVVHPEKEAGYLAARHCDETRALAYELARELEIAEACAHVGTAPCGHSEQYLFSEDGGKHIVCLLCERSSARSSARLAIDADALRYAKSFIKAEDTNENQYKDIRLSAMARELVRLETSARNAAPVACTASGIYVASRVKQAEVWKAYRARGWKINASWIDEAGEGETADFGELWERIRGEIERSHALVFYAGGVEDFPFKGALVEVGMALAMGKPVIVALENVMLDGRTMRPVGSWLLDRKVIRCDTLEEAMEVARGAELLCKPSARPAGAVAGAEKRD